MASVGPFVEASCLTFPRHRCESCSLTAPGSQASGCFASSRFLWAGSGVTPSATAVAWLTDRLKVTAPAKPWEESAQLFGSRVKQAADYVNTHYDVAALQMELPARLHTLIAREGGRIGK